jgi:hypothetical protein
VNGYPLYLFDAHACDGKRTSSLKEELDRKQDEAKMTTPPGASLGKRVQQGRQQGAQGGRVKLPSMVPRGGQGQGWGVCCSLPLPNTSKIRPKISRHSEAMVTDWLHYLLRGSLRHCFPHGVKTSGVMVGFISLMVVSLWGRGSNHLFSY